MDKRQIRFLDVNVAKLKNANWSIDQMVVNATYNKNVVFVQEPQYNKVKDLIPDLKKSNTIRYINKPNENRQIRALIYYERDEDVTFTKNSQLTDPDCAVGLMKYTKQDGNSSRTLLASLYCDITTDISVDIKKMEKIVKHCRSCRYKLIICMDANAHHAMWGDKKNDQRGRKLLDFIEKEKLKIENNGDPTFSRGNTCIDLTLTLNLDGEIKDWHTEEEDHALETDHYPINFYIDRFEKVTVKFRNVKLLDKELFVQHIEENISEVSKIVDSKDCEKVAKELEKLQKNALKAATKTIWFKTWKRNEWYTADLLIQKRNVNRLCKQWKRERNRHKDVRIEEKAQHDVLINENHQAYKTARNRYFYEIKIAKLADDNAKMGKVKTFEEAAKIARNKNHLSACITNIDTYSGTSEEIVEEIVNAHFPSNSSTRPDQGFVEAPLEYDDETCELICEENIKHCLEKMGNYKAPGIDGIYPIMLKTSFESIKNHLIELFRFSYATGYIPARWLKIRTIFIPKPDRSHTKAKDFRPIALMSTMIKLMEHVTCLDINDLIFNLEYEQYAYRKKRSTIQALNDLLTGIEEDIDTNEVTWAAFMDVEGAFDRVSHDIIFKKLREGNVNEKTVKWIETMLKFRTVILKVNDCEKHIYATNGVPQGSVLACRLWIICMNDLILNVKEKFTEGVKMIVYSDDLSIRVTHKDEKKIDEIMNNILRYINKWSSQNGLNLNREKCDFMRFTSRDTKFRPTRQFQKTTIKFAEHVRYLGIYIDKNLDFKIQLNKIREKATKYLCMIRSMTGRTWGVKTKLIKHIYMSIIVPKVFYGSAIWYHKASANASIINKIGNNALKIISGLFRNTLNLAVNAVLGIPPMTELLKAHTTMEILRLYTKNQWDINSLKGHYITNKKLKIRNIIDSSDLTNVQVVTEVKTVISSRKEWLENTINLNDSRIQCYTDGSVRKDINRTGVGVICTGLINFKISEQYDLTTSSYLAEARAFKLGLREMINRDVKNEQINFGIDNQSVIISTANNCLQSNTFNEIKSMINILRERNNSITITWVPSHLDTPYLMQNKELRFNAIADQLAAATYAKVVEWKPALLKNNIKRNLMIDAFENTRKLWDKKSSIAKNFKLNQLNENMINSLKGNTKRTCNLLHLSREDFFLITSFCTGTGFNRDHMQKIVPMNPKLKCRLCDDADETTTHLFTKCRKLHRIRQSLYMYKEIDLDRDIIDFDVQKMLNFLNRSNLRDKLLSWDDEIENDRT